MRPVRFDPVEPTKTSGAKFWSKHMDGVSLRDTHFQDNSRQTLNNTYHRFTNALIKDNLFDAKKSTNDGIQAVWKKWYMRMYDFQGTIEHNHFKRWLVEHDVYLNMAPGETFVTNNYFQGAYSQALQTTFRDGSDGKHNPETSNPDWVNASGKLWVAHNLVKNCGHTGRMWNRGIARPGFAFSQHKCLAGLEVYYHNNHLIQTGTGPFKYSGGQAEAFGAIMAQDKAYTEGAGLVIDYAIPADRPLIQLDGNDEDYWVGNRFVQPGGTVMFIHPGNLVWTGNSGEKKTYVQDGKTKVLQTLVKHKRWDGQNKRWVTSTLGPVEGHYEFANGKRVK